MIWKEIAVTGYGNKIYGRVNKSYDELTHENTEYSKCLGLKVTEKGKTKRIMYWIPKIHKNVTGVFFFVASKICSTKQISKSTPNVFKLIYSQIETFHKNPKLLTNYNNFSVLQNADPIIQSPNSI